MIKLVAQGSTLDLSHPYVVDILSATSSSFSDGGVHNSLAEAVKYASLMINAGATIVDIGGESTWPRMAEVGVEEELARVIPVAEAIAQHFEMWISAGTSGPKTIRESTRTGTHIINGIRSLTEPDVLQAVAETGLPVCLMHMQGQPKTMQEAPRYENVLVDVKYSFAEHTVCCEQARITKEKLLLDPGFGFDKNLFRNYQLLARLSEFRHLGLSLLAGMSWKSMAGQLLNVGLSERLNDNLAYAAIATTRDAQIIRVHDVKETVETLRAVGAIPIAKEKKCYE